MGVPRRDSLHLPSHAVALFTFLEKTACRVSQRPLFTFLLSVQCMKVPVFPWAQQHPFLCFGYRCFTLALVLCISLLVCMCVHICMHTCHGIHAPRSEDSLSQFSPSLHSVGSRPCTQVIGLGSMHPFTC